MPETAMPIHEVKALEKKLAFALDDVRRYARSMRQAMERANKTAQDLALLVEEHTR